MCAPAPTATAARLRDVLCRQERRSAALLASLALVVCVARAEAAEPQPAAPALAMAIAVQAELAAPRAARPRDAGPQAALQALYAARAHQPLWLDGAARPGTAASQALSLLAAADVDGLVPADYQAAALAERAAALSAPGALPASGELAAWDVALSRHLLRYLHELHFGRVDAGALGFRVAKRAADEHDRAAMLAAAASTGRLAALAEEMAPPLSQYRRLREQLARYRAMPDAEFAPLAATPTVRPGDEYADAAQVQRRLVLLGDLDAVALPDTVATHYDGALVDAVQRFQSRHGLEADGLLGKATRAALGVPPSARARQIALAMERLRWLPHQAGQALVAINIPMFRLWAVDPAAPPGAQPLGMNVIVGRALKTRTPVLSEDMRYLIFRPYWNVPKSIVRNEVLPALARNPGYLARNAMEIVRGPGDDAVPVPADAANLALLRLGALRLRQRPGPGNSLGLVKFMFPNDEAVYLHDTPKPQLFGRTRRDFSHGCVRVEDPVALAQWALRDQPEWTRERIVAAMSEPGPPLRVDLTRPVPVLLYYLTALVLPGEGGMHFATDLYGHDTRLAAALAARSRR